MDDKCGTCDPEIRQHDRGWGSGCLEGDVYDWCSDEGCGGWCEYQGICDCTCHGRDSRGRLVEQLRPSLWP